MQRCRGKNCDFRGSHSGQPRRIHNRQRPTGFKIIDDHQPCGLRKAELFRIVGISLNPLAAHRDHAWLKSRHRVIENLRVGMGTDFCRYFIAMVTVLNKRILGNVQDFSEVDAYIQNIMLLRYTISLPSSRSEKVARAVAIIMATLFGSG